MTRSVPIASTLLALALALPVGCGGGGSSSSSSDTTTDTGATTDTTTDTGTSGGTTTLTITGSVKVASADLAAAAVSTSALPTTADQDLAGATVTLVKMKPDGTEELVDIGTVTTDATGAFSIPDVPPVEAGSGAATDAYYEVRVTKGTVEEAVPLAPTGDTTVEVTPETSIAADILGDVVDAPTLDTRPIPSKETIDAVVNQTAGDLQAMSGLVDIPSADTATQADDQADFTDMAHGVASAGGNAEVVARAAQYESEYLGLTADSATTSDVYTGYLTRLVRDACGEPADNPMPAPAVEAAATELVAGTTYTLQQVVDAYTVANPATALTVAGVVSSLNSDRAALDAALDATDGATPIDGDGQLLLVGHGRVATFAADTALAPDMVLVLLQYLASLEATGDDPCPLDKLTAGKALAELFGDATLATLRIADYQIYNNSGFGCDEAAGEGHLVAEVELSVPAGVTIDSVTVAADDPAALGGAPISLTEDPPGSGRWRNAADGNCVPEDKTITYTITATPTSGSPVTMAVDRFHVHVPEPTVQHHGTDMVSTSDAPTAVSTARPLFTWTQPDVLLAQITGAPADAKVKYGYEFAHIDTTASPQGPLPSCDATNASGEQRLYSVSAFIPTVDCDPAACAAASGVAEANIACRIAIQTFLLDGDDRYQSQAAGTFRFFKVTPVP